jgi:hypothetical protein
LHARFMMELVDPYFMYIGFIVKLVNI